MKYFGCKSECYKERSRDLLRAYFSYLKSCSHVYMPDVFRHVVEMPARQFWVSVPRAAVVVTAIMKGDTLSSMRDNKREMFFEIHRRVVQLKQRYPDWSISKLVREVVSQPAPKFYLEPGSARVLILKERKLWFEEKSKRQQLYL